MNISVESKTLYLNSETVNKIFYDFCECINNYTETSTTNDFNDFISKFISQYKLYNVYDIEVVNFLFSNDFNDNNYNKDGINFYAYSVVVNIFLMSLSTIKTVNLYIDGYFLKIFKMLDNNYYNTNFNLSDNVEFHVDYYCIYISIIDFIIFYSNNSKTSFLQGNFYCSSVLYDPELKVRTKSFKKNNSIGLKSFCESLEDLSLELNINDYSDFTYLNFFNIMATYKSYFSNRKLSLVTCSNNIANDINWFMDFVNIIGKENIRALHIQFDLSEYIYICFKERKLLKVKKDNKSNKYIKEIKEKMNNRFWRDNIDNNNQVKNFDKNIIKIVEQLFKKICNYTILNNKSEKNEIGSSNSINTEVDFSLSFIENINLNLPSGVIGKIQSTISKYLDSAIFQDNGFRIRNMVLDVPDYNYLRFLARKKSIQIKQSIVKEEESTIITSTSTLSSVSVLSSLKITFGNNIPVENNTLTNLNIPLLYSLKELYLHNISYNTFIKIFSPDNSELKDPRYIKNLIVIDISINCLDNDNTDDYYIKTFLDLENLKYLKELKVLKLTINNLKSQFCMSQKYMKNILYNILNKGNLDYFYVTLNTNSIKTEEDRKKSINKKKQKIYEMEIKEIDKKITDEKLAVKINMESSNTNISLKQEDTECYIKKTNNFYEIEKYYRDHLANKFIKNSCLKCNLCKEFSLNKSNNSTSNAKNNKTYNNEKNNTSTNDTTNKNKYCDVNFSKYLKIVDGINEFLQEDVKFYLTENNTY